MAAWGVVAAWEPWLAQASVAGVAGDPFLNSNAILLDYLSQAELERADPSSVPADAANLSGGTEGALQPLAYLYHNGVASLRASRLTCLSPCAPPHLAPLALRFQPASTRLARPAALGRRRRGGRVRHEPSAANG